MQRHQAKKQKQMEEEKGVKAGKKEKSQRDIQTFWNRRKSSLSESSSGSESDPTDAQFQTIADSCRRKFGERPPSPKSMSDDEDLKPKTKKKYNAGSRFLAKDADQGNSDIQRKRVKDTKIKKGFQGEGKRQKRYE